MLWKINLHCTCLVLKLSLYKLNAIHFHIVSYNVVWIVTKMSSIVLPYGACINVYNFETVNTIHK